MLEKFSSEHHPFKEGKVFSFGFVSLYYIAKIYHLYSLVLAGLRSLSFVHLELSNIVLGLGLSGFASLILT